MVHGDLEQVIEVRAAGVLAMFATLQNQVDQINVMTYAMSGAFPGWVSWFTGAVFDGDFRFPNTSRLVPSTHALSNFIGHGIAREKLAIGIYFAGHVWAGGMGTTNGGIAFPRQSWTNKPSVAPILFHQVMGLWFQTNNYRWDAAAQAAYLTFDDPGTNLPSKSGVRAK